MPKDITYVLVYTADGHQYKEGFDDLLIAYRRCEKIRQEAETAEIATIRKWFYEKEKKNEEH